MTTTNHTLRMVKKIEESPGKPIGIRLSNAALTSDLTIRTAENSGTGRYHFPNDFAIAVYASGVIFEPEKIQWHWSYPDQANDGIWPDYFYIVPIGSGLAISTDTSPVTIHPLPALTPFGNLRVWYEYKGFVSPVLNIPVNDSGNPLPAASAVGMVDETLNPTDLITNRSFQYQQFTSGDNLWYPLDFKQQVFITDHGDNGATGRVVTWHYQYGSDPVDTLPAGLTAMPYEQTKLMGCAALGICPDTNLNAVVGLSALDALTVWAEIDGVLSSSAVMTLISAGTF